MSTKRILAIGEALGLIPAPRPGFVGMSDPNDLSGRRRLDVFTWQGDKHADSAGIPRKYLVLCPSFDGSEAGRWAVPLVHWLDTQGRRIPSAQQQARPWPQVHDEAVQALQAAFAAGTKREAIWAMKSLWRLGGLLEHGKEFSAIPESRPDSVIESLPNAGREHSE